MIDDIKRKKYNNLKHNLSIIETKLGELNTQYDKVNNNLKSGININNQTYKEENLLQLKKFNDEVINDINSIVKPIINNNI